jgi:hypothetical protein
MIKKINYQISKALVENIEYNENSGGMTGDTISCPICKKYHFSLNEHMIQHKEDCAITLAREVVNEYEKPQPKIKPIGCCPKCKNTKIYAEYRSPWSTRICYDCGWKEKEGEQWEVTP